MSPEVPAPHRKTYSLDPVKTVHYRLPNCHIEKPDSLLAKVCGKTHLRVNNLHHQAIKNPGTGLNVVGRDLDDITQAVESPVDRSIFGVQWHPEYLFYLPSQFALFRSLSRMTNNLRSEYCIRPFHGRQPNPWHAAYPLSRASRISKSGWYCPTSLCRSVCSDR